MSFTDTANAKKYASIAEVAASQAKMSAEKLDGAPEYAEQAEESARLASLSADRAEAVVSEVNSLASQASESATSAEESAATAAGATEAAISRCVRAPSGEMLQDLPSADARKNSVAVFGSQGEVGTKPLSGFATLDSDGKIPVSVIPSIALTEPFVVSNEQEMLSLDAQVGDIAKRTDLGYSFCLAEVPASTLSNWIQLTDDVLSQLGQSSGATSIGAVDDLGTPTTVQAQLLLKASKSETSLQISELQEQITEEKKVVGFVNFYQFGAVGDGVSDDTTAVSNAFNYASENNMKVVQRDGVFLLTGGTYITITRDADLTGSVIKPSSSYTGQIVMTQPGSANTYVAGSPEITAINATSATNRTAGSAYFDGISSITSLNGCYIQMESPQQMYTFRDIIKTRVELNRVYNQGNLEVPLRYQLPNNVSSIKSIKIKDNVTTVTGMTIDESLTTRYRIIYINQATRFVLKNTSFINRPVTQSFSDSRVDVESSYDVTIDGLFAPSVANSSSGTGPIYSYTLGLYTSMNVTVKNVNAGGQGWGANGSNTCACVLFEDCNINRVDFHEPFQQWLKINRCRIGRWGVLVTGVGDLIIDNTTFVAGLDGESGIISTRGDAGGWFDGDLYMNNVIFTGKGSSSIKSLITGNSEVNQGPVPGSPIASTLFNKIYIRDFKCREGGVINSFNTLISSNRDSVLLYPKVVDIDGMSFGSLSKSSGIGLNIDFSNFKPLYSDMNNSESSVTGRFTSDIYLRNIQTPYISISGAGTSGTARQNPRVIAENVRNTVPGEGATLFETNQRGNYEFNESKLERIKLVFSNLPNGSVFFKMNGGSIVQPVTATLPIFAGDDSNTIVLDNVAVAAQFSAQASYAINANLSRYALMKRCEFYDIVGGRLYNLALAAPNALTYTHSTPLRVGQEIYVTNGYNSDSTYSISRIRIPHASAVVRSFVAGSTNSLSAAFTISGGLATAIAFSAPNNIIEVGI